MRLSLVVPCYNEQDGLGRLHQRLCETLPAVTDDFEVLLVDDGSSDRTLAAMREIASTDPRFRYLALSRNFGKESAMLAGLSQAEGDIVAIIDADLQHPPEMLAQMVDKLDEGYDQVVARRTRDGDGALRSLISTAYYKMINKLVDVKLENGVGDFRVLTRKAVQALLSLGEYNRFSKGLFSWIGFDTATVDYGNVVRQDGTSKWSARKLIDYGIDGVVSFNNRPLRLAIYLGALCTVFAFVYAIWVLVAALINGNSVPGYVTLMCGIVGFGGLQLLILGVIGEYLGRIYYETKRRPHFLIKEASQAEVPVAVPLGPERAEDLALHTSNGHIPGSGGLANGATTGAAK
ncbi:MAG TPA: glycosyltransferase family 2 protein [Pseudonocardiaceae bacterium]|jgi:glycosyltransferase involved in cell wall biosynthesis|nr:glycosyltransferase family 2 protein [Pseudonocardiaceae bacterium]